MIGPEVEAEVVYRQERVRALFAAGQNAKAHATARRKRLVQALRDAAERFRQSGTESDRKRMWDAFDAVKADEESPATDATVTGPERRSADESPALQPSTPEDRRTA